MSPRKTAAQPTTAAPTAEAPTVEVATPAPDAITAIEDTPSIAVSPEPEPVLAPAVDTTKEAPAEPVMLVEPTPTLSQLRSEAYSAATRTIRERYRAEFEKELQAEYETRGLEYKPRKTKEEREREAEAAAAAAAAARIQEILAKHPGAKALLAGQDGGQA